MNEERLVPRHDKDNLDKYNCKFCGNTRLTNPAECYTVEARNQCRHWERMLERLGEIPNPKESVNHPQHYGGDTTYEVIKVIEAWGLDNDFCLANTVKYIARAGKKRDLLEDLKKASWYLNRKISNLLEKEIDDKINDLEKINDKR